MRARSVGGDICFVPTQPIVVLWRPSTDPRTRLGCERERTKFARMGRGAESRADPLRSLSASVRRLRTGEMHFACDMNRRCTRTFEYSDLVVQCIL